MLVSPVKMIDTRYTCFTLSRQTGKDQRYRCPQIRRHDRRALELFDAGHCRSAALNIDAGPHAHQFRRMHEPVFKDLFFQNGRTRGRAKQRHHLRLQIGRKAGERRRRHINRADVAVFALHGQAVHRLGDLDTGRVQLFAERTQQTDTPSQQFDFAPANRRGEHVGSQLDAIRHNGVGRAAEAIDAFNRDGRCPLALDLRTHCAQTNGKINDLRLPCGIVQHRRTLGQSGRHQRVFRRSDAGKCEVDDAAAQTFRRRSVNVAIFQIQLCPHDLQRLKVQIDGPGTDSTSTGKRDNRLPRPGEQGTENEDRGPHFAHDVIMSGMVVEAMGRQGNHLALLQARHLGSE